MAEKIARIKEDVYKRLSQKKLDLGASSISDTISECLDLLEQIENIANKCSFDDTDNAQATIAIEALFNKNK